MRGRGRVIIVVSALNLLACAALIDLQEPSQSTNDDAGALDGTASDGTTTSDASSEATTSQADASIDFGEGGVVSIATEVLAIAPFGPDGIAYLDIGGVHVLDSAGVEVDAGLSPVPATALDGGYAATPMTIAQLQTADGTPYLAVAGRAMSKTSQRDGVWIASLQPTISTDKLGVDTGLGTTGEPAVPVLVLVTSLISSGTATLAALVEDDNAGNHRTQLFNNVNTTAQIEYSSMGHAHAFAHASASAMYPSASYAVLASQGATGQFSLYDSKFDLIPTPPYDGGALALSGPAHGLALAAVDDGFLGLIGDSKGLEGARFATPGVGPPTFNVLMAVDGGLQITSAAVDGDRVYVGGCSTNDFTDNVPWVARLNASEESIDSSFGAGTLSSDVGDCIFALVLDGQQRPYALINDTVNDGFGSRIVRLNP